MNIAEMKEQLEGCRAAIAKRKEELHAADPAVVRLSGVENFLINRIEVELTEERELAHQQPPSPPAVTPEPQKTE